MKIYIWPSDLWACGHYRAVFPAEVVKATYPDIDVEVMRPVKGAHTGLLAYMDRDDNVIGAACPEDADLLVLQRPSFRQLVESIPHYRAKGVAVVVDIDDDLAAIDPRNPAFTALHPDPHNLIPPPRGVRTPEQMKRWQEHARRVYVDRSGHSWKAVKDAAASATLTTVSTPALAERYGRGNARVLPNYVPARFLDVEHEDSDTIGWPGSTHSHPGDLKVMGPAIARLTREGHRFMVVGDGTGAERDLGLPEPPEQTGPIAFDNWMPNVARIGVGVAPLADTRFNIGKSRLKPLEMSTTGVPWVASPRAEYQKFHAEGVGVLAERPKDWYRALKRLCSDPELRVDQSAAGREVASRMTIEAHAWRWAEIWTEAVTLERARRPATVD